jgi:hypothetical protein
LRHYSFKKVPLHRTDEHRRFVGLTLLQREFRAKRMLACCSPKTISSTGGSGGSTSGSTRTGLALWVRQQEASAFDCTETALPQ